MSFSERWGLRIHLWICGNCKRFERQIVLVRRLLRQAELCIETEMAEAELSIETRERISAALAGQQYHDSKPSV